MKSFNIAVSDLQFLDEQNSAPLVRITSGFELRNVAGLFNNLGNINLLVDLDNDFYRYL
jgi:hypothetical protein